MNQLKAELKSLYSDASKHSVYQNVPDFVSAELGYSESIDETWRGDRPRLAYLLSVRTPEPGERWLDFGANTGFFALSLAHRFPSTRFTAVEANPNHARFIKCVTRYFDMKNVEVVNRSVALDELNTLPATDFLLHLNVLHHAGHDFDAELVQEKSQFAPYAQRYLARLRERSKSMLFQLGSNWGGVKQQPLISVRDDLGKLELFSSWLRLAGWHIAKIAYPKHEVEENINYRPLSVETCVKFSHGGAIHPESLQVEFDSLDLDLFPGEFYRRPLFLCDHRG